MRMPWPAFPEMVFGKDVESPIVLAPVPDTTTPWPPFGNATVPARPYHIVVKDIVDSRRALDAHA